MELGSRSIASLAAAPDEQRIGAFVEKRKPTLKELELRSPSTSPANCVRR